MTELLRPGIGTATRLITTNRNSKRTTIVAGFKDSNEFLRNTGTADLTVAFAKLLWLRTIPIRPGISQMVCELSKSGIS